MFANLCDASTTLLDTPNATNPCLFYLSAPQARAVQNQICTCLLKELDVDP
jgi:hypothetical protein